MSHLLEFRPTRPLPHAIHAPPYVVFGICGTAVTSSLPPLIPLKLVLHFAPALRKWILPAPDPAYLPRPVAREAIRTPYIGIDIQVPVDAEGLCWIITRMLQLSGRAVRREMFSVHPNLATSLAIRNAWLALGLHVEGLRNLHTHIHAQLMLGSQPVYLWDMRMLWSAFPSSSQIVKAMGLNYIQAQGKAEYSIKDSLEIVSWFQSTPELYAFFKSLRDATPESKEEGRELGSMLVVLEKENFVNLGSKTIGKKSGRGIKAALAAQAGGQVAIMERDATRKVSPTERQERETRDFEAMRTRLRRTRSDDSLRSVDTAIWDPQTPDEEGQEEEQGESSESNDTDAPYSYFNGSLSAALARTLETIRTRREARLVRNKRSTQPPEEDIAMLDREQHSAETKPVCKTERRRLRRSVTP